MYWFEVLLEYYNLISEVGDLNNIEPFDFKLQGDKGYFTVDGGKEVEMWVFLIPERFLKSFKNIPEDFNHKTNPIYDLGFKVNGKLGRDKNNVEGKSELKTFLRIIKTVSIFAKSRLEDIYKRHPKQKPIMTISSDDGNAILDKTKYSLYKKVIESQMSSGYKVGEGMFDSKTITLIQKSN